jgi:hypothetical protein
VLNLDNTVSELCSRGWKKENKVEIPPGPCCTFRNPADNCIAIYEKQRPYVIGESKGRINSKQNIYYCSESLSSKKKKQGGRESWLQDHETCNMDLVHLQHM